MEQDQRFDDMVARLRAGDDEAAARVFNRFANRLVGLARARLQQNVRQKVDPEDVLQSVFKSFFIRHASGELNISSWDNLWTVLTCITVRKCSNQQKFFNRGRRSVQRETQPQSDASDTANAWQALARDPTPEEQVMIAETVAEVLAGLDARDRDIVSLCLQGRTVPEISQEVGFAERTVRRVVEHVRKHLETRLTADS